MDETSKSSGRRKHLHHFRDYLKGNGLDIGCGPDPLKVKSGTVRGWDLPDGDAQLLKGVEDGSFDFVYSSHCLEHMRDVAESLMNWARVIKPGGILYVVVPDYTLYEQHRWPSINNPDHKQSFSTWLAREKVGRPNHHHIHNDIVPLLQRLGVRTLDVSLEDDGYDYNIGPGDQTLGKALAQICFIGRRVAPWPA
jgi:SAM-dependent methyltransferase